MMYNIKIYCVLELCPSSRILKCIKDVSYRKLGLLVVSSGKELGVTRSVGYIGKN
jgi:hypothetical protein